MEEDDESKWYSIKLTSRQKLTLVNGAFGNIVLYGCYSLIEPFLIDVAVEKGVSLTAAGVMFGVHEITMLFCSIIIGSQLSDIGVKRCFCVGTLVIGISTVIFGFLDHCSSGGSFLGLGIAARVVTGIGGSLNFTANYSLATKEFRENVASAYGFLEMFAGIGLLLGPLVGGGLYQLGGFGLPFYVAGAFSILFGVVAFLTLPSDTIDKEMESDHLQMIKLAKIPIIPLEHLGIFVGFFGLAALFPTLGPHLEKVDVSMEGDHFMIGLVYALYGAAFTVFVPLVGLLEDRYDHAKAMAVSGALVTALSFTLVGPWYPLTGFFTNHRGASWAVFLGSCLCGVGTAIINVAVLADCVTEAVSHGLPDNIITYGNLSALFEVSMGMGNFIGPLIGAAIVEYNPFSTLSGVLTALCVGQAGLLVLYYAINHGLKSRDGESDISENIDSLLQNKSADETRKKSLQVILGAVPRPVIQSRLVQPSEDR